MVRPFKTVMDRVITDENGNVLGGETPLNVNIVSSDVELGSPSTANYSFIELEIEDEFTLARSGSWRWWSVVDEVVNTMIESTDVVLGSLQNSPASGLGLQVSPFKVEDTDQYGLYFNFTNVNSGEIIVPAGLKVNVVVIKRGNHPVEKFKVNPPAPEPEPEPNPDEPE